MPALALALVVCLSAEPTSTVSIVSPVGANPIERLAADELAAYLARLYPEVRVVRQPQAGVPTVIVGDASREGLRGHPAAAALRSPEEFVIAVDTSAGQTRAAIIGASPIATPPAVYSLLERLGCGFFFSGDRLPPPRRGPLEFDGWAMTDRPLVRDRIVFNWHNFLSGCSGWDEADWVRWIDQSHKMRFNTIMVHAYANNPIFTFEHLGQVKEVGYLPNTRLGRDWGNVHVNDVRRLVGGELFDGPVFGPQAAAAPAERRVAAATALIRKAFDRAAERGMGICFALDVDTATAQPQPIIERLPESARFRITVRGPRPLVGESAPTIWLVNPDTPEGYAYYKAQAAALFKLYPPINRLALWMRKERSPWLALTVAEMPAEWQRQFAALSPDLPDDRDWRESPGRFALGKVAVAFARALQELGRKDVRLFAGSWGFEWLAPTDRFFPREFGLMPLDYDILGGRPSLEDPQWQKAVRAITARRPVAPIAWAHHDDGGYIGRSYRPAEGFASVLRASGADGFGIIHWTTRPLDLFFRSLSEQVWAASADRPLKATCRLAAERLFAAHEGERLGAYLQDWLSTAPLFARETTDWFNDHPISLAAAEEIAAGCTRRLRLLTAVDPAALAPEGREALAYFRGQEEFVAAFFRAEAGCQAAMAAGDVAAARTALAAVDAEDVLRRYARTIAHGGVNRGELGVLLAMNLNWRAFVENARQAAGLCPVRWCFGPTEHEPMAQGAGRLTFHIEQGGLWRRLGEKETGATAWHSDAAVKPAAGFPAEAAEVCRAGVETDKPLRLLLRPIVYDLQPFRGRPPVAGGIAPGKVRVRLLLVDPSESAAGRRVFDARLSTTGGDESRAVSRRIDIARQVGRGTACAVDFDYDLPPPGWLELTLRPVTGKAILSGVIVEPVGRAGTH